MVDRQTCCVVLQQDECWAADVSRRSVESFDDGSDEACLPGTKVTNEPDDESGQGGLTESEAQAMGVVFLFGIESDWLHPGRAGTSRVEWGRDGGADRMQVCSRECNRGLGGPGCRRLARRLCCRVSNNLTDSSPKEFPQSCSLHLVFGRPSPAIVG